VSPRASVAKILIVNLTRFGDLLQTSPALAALKRRHPNAAITLMAEKNFADVCDDIPGIDRVYRVELDRVGKLMLDGGAHLLEAYRYVEQIIGELRAERFDLALNYSSSRMSAVFMGLLKAAGFRAVSGWKNANYGPGILDATALLAAPLPAQAPIVVARPHQAIAASQRSYAWARLQPYFPQLSPEQLARAVVPAFGKRPAVAARRLADVIDEVEFFVATDSAVRQSVIAAAAPARRGRGAIATTSAAKSALLGVGSPRLRELLKG